MCVCACSCMNECTQVSCCSYFSSIFHFFPIFNRSTVICLFSFLLLSPRFTHTIFSPSCFAVVVVVDFVVFQLLFISCFCLPLILCSCSSLRSRTQKLSNALSVCQKSWFFCHLLLPNIYSHIHVRLLNFVWVWFVFLLFQMCLMFVVVSFRFCPVLVFRVPNCCLASASTTPTASHLTDTGSGSIWQMRSTRTLSEHRGCITLVDSSPNSSLRVSLSRLETNNCVLYLWYEINIA